MEHSYAWFGDENRTSATINCHLFLLTFVWVVIYVSVVFLLLTGVGRKFSTFITTSLSLISGATITLGIYDREWVHGRLQTEASYSRFMPTAVPGILSVSLGLSKMNISYVSLDPGMDFFYNEQFKLDDEWHNENILQEEYVKALMKGSPNPVLEILEFLSFGGFAFCYRKAGFVTLSGLWISLTMWAFCQALLLVVPKAASRAFFFTGSMTLLSAVFYFNSIPSSSLQMYVEGVRLDLSIGRTFYLVVAGGFINIVLSIVFGVGVRCKTSFEVYYRTEFDFYGKGTKNSFELEDINENGRWAEGWNDDYKNYSVIRVCDGSLYPRPVRNNIESVYDDKDDYQIAHVNEGFVDDTEITCVKESFVNESLSGENLLNSHHKEVTKVNIDTPVREFIRKSKFFRKSRRKSSQDMVDCEDDYIEKGIDNRPTDIESVYDDKYDYQIAHVNEGFVEDTEITYAKESFVNEPLSVDNLLNSHHKVTKVNIEMPVREFIRKSKFFRKSRRKSSQDLLDCEDDDTEKGIDDRHTDVLNNIRRVQSVIKDSVNDIPEHVVDDVIWYDTVDKLI